MGGSKLGAHAVSCTHDVRKSHDDALQNKFNKKD